MPEHLQGVLYTAVAVVEGESMGGSGGPGTNPEELFAVGPTGHGGFGLTVAPDLHAPRLTAEQAADVMARAHQRCPYSIATCANIDVEQRFPHRSAAREVPACAGPFRATAGPNHAGSFHCT